MRDRLVKIGAFQSLDELLEGAGLFLAERKKLETIVISPPVTEHSADVPGGGQAGEGKVQGDDLAGGEFGREQHSNTGFGQVFAMGLQALVAAGGEQSDQHRK